MTAKMVKTPAVVMDKEPPADQCQCTDVQRRWDGDGIAEVKDGKHWYVCTACGKKYG